MKLSFHPYKERPKRTPYATWASFLVRAAPRLRDGLELELPWASTSGTRTELASGLLLDLDTLASLLPLHTMCQTWSYAWVSCPHHPPLLNEKPSSTSIVLEKLILNNTKEKGVAKTKETKIIVRRNVTMFPSF